MSDRPIRVLCFDIEGGHGGSSRSLFEVVRYLDQRLVAPEVWCRRSSLLQGRYADLGVTVRIEPTMPKVSALPTLSRNLVVIGRLLPELIPARGFLTRAASEIRDRFDLVHFNHEALFLAAAWLRHRIAVPCTMHMRTNLWDTPFARWQIGSISRSADHVVFITENEQRTFERLGGRPKTSSVIYNAVTMPSGQAQRHPDVPNAGRFGIACLSSYSWGRGLDRLVDIAAELAGAGRRDIMFVMAGEMDLTRSLPGELGRIGRRGGTLADYAEHRGVGDMFTFLGHVPDPERVLAACDMLAKPTREANPWGRDILEAMAAGVPALSIGTYDRFVEDGVTGLLQADFDAVDLARKIAALADDPARCSQLGKAARERVRTLCDGPARAAELAAVWRDAADAR